MKHILCNALFEYPNVHQGAGLKPFGWGPLAPAAATAVKSEPRLRLWMLLPQRSKVTEFPKQQEVEVSNYLSDGTFFCLRLQLAGGLRGLGLSGQHELADVAEVVVEEPQVPLTLNPWETK